MEEEKKNIPNADVCSWAVNEGMCAYDCAFLKVLWTSVTPMGQKEKEFNRDFTEKLLCSINFLPVLNREILLLCSP